MDKILKIPAVFLLIYLLLLSISFTQDHWETAIYSDDNWNYDLPDNEPHYSWRLLSFNDSNWDNGPGGFGYSDGDDQTIVNQTISVYLRRAFNIEDKDKLVEAIFHADYDDGFIAYLNGTEFARSANLGNFGSFIPYNEGTDWDHEAQMYQGGEPEAFTLDSDSLEELLENGQNILAIQVHNVSITSSDLSSNFFLTFGISDESSFYGPPPDWFTTPVTYDSSHLPIVIIDTEGQEIVSQYKITAQMGIISNGPGELNYLSDPFNHYEGQIGIEIRGSSSQMFPKKQYAVETRDGTGENLNFPLLDLPSENDWILYAPYSDKSLIRNVLSYKLARDTGRYASRSEFCEVYINGDYKGLYVLMEKIKRDNNRVDISSIDPDDIAGDSLTGGYIVKVDKWEGENNQGWYSPIQYQYHDPTFIQYHYPKPDNLVNEQMTYIQNYMNGFEALMASNQYDDPETGYYNVINLNSFIHVALMNEISRNVDGYRLSAFMYKDRDSIDGRLTMGPIWDYNLAFGNADYYDGANPEGWQIEFENDWDQFANPFWWMRAWQDTTFRNTFNYQWQTLRQTVFSDAYILSEIDSLVNIIGDASIRNFQRWPILDQYVWPNAYIGNTYENEIIYLKDWILNRMTWIDSQTQVDPGQWLLPELVINEFLAINNTTISDELDEYDDWLEIYNYGAESIDIGGMHLSDDLSNLSKYQIPEGDPSTIIPGGGFLLVWCDNDGEQGALHTTFNLGSGGDDVVLVKNDGFTIIDSYSFGLQTEDISKGRVEDGAEDWVFFVNPSPGLTNSSGECLPGDVTGDGALDGLDIVMIVNCILDNTGECNCADLDNSGDLDILDLVLIINLILD